MTPSSWKFEIAPTDGGQFIFRLEEVFPSKDGASAAESVAKAAGPVLAKLFSKADVRVEGDTLIAELHGPLSYIANFMVGEFIGMSDLGKMNIAQLVTFLGASQMKA